MKKTSIILILLLISMKVTACSCDWSGNFLKTVTNSELVIKGKIIEHNYHTANGKRFKDFDKYFEETQKNEFDTHYGTGESIRVEILEIIKGKEKRKIIEIFDTDGADCRATIREFETGKTYIFATYKPRRKGMKLPNETENDYAIGSCYESTLEYLPQENKVFGMIEGKSYNQKKQKYSYEKLKSKIENRS